MKLTTPLPLFANDAIYYQFYYIFAIDCSSRISKSFSFLCVCQCESEEGMTKFIQISHSTLLATFYF